MLPDKLMKDYQIDLYLWARNNIFKAIYMYYKGAPPDKGNDEKNEDEKKEKINKHINDLLEFYQQKLQRIKYIGEEF